MKLLIDADACPVVAESVALAKKYKIDTHLFCDTSHLLQSEDATVHTVSKGADSADFALVAMADRESVVVTQDYGVAALCLAKGARALNQNGVVFTNENIDGMLFSRYLTKKTKASGGRVKGPKKREKNQDDAFTASLERLIKEFV